MVCIYCGSKTSVYNSRPASRVNQIWRRRKCLSCGGIFSTREAADYNAGWSVKNNQHQIEPFIKEKLFVSLLKSLEHRPRAIQEASSLTDTITNKLRVHLKDGILHSQIIIQVSEVALARFDKQACMHYQALHRPA